MYEPFKLIFLFLSFMIQGQTKNTMYLWLKKVLNKVASKPRLTNNTKENVMHITDVPNSTLAVFYPQKLNNSDIGHLFIWE